jgi:hypothetical protein
MSVSRAGSQTGSSCLDVDEIVALVVALDEDPASKLGHALGCERCRANLGTLARLRDPLYVGEASPEGTDDAERFLATFAASAAMRPRALDIDCVLIRIVAVLAAAATAVSATLLVSARAVEVSPLGGLTAALLGVLALVVGERSRGPGTTGRSSPAP